ncbi:MAG: hypothetical protein EOQ33_34235 [Mesorhizobium sp.]|nr:MAG: hypothetical protein EOQ33_34235 [Mesorhizobium sp.]
MTRRQIALSVCGRARIIGIGVETADVLVNEILSRRLRACTGSSVRRDRHMREREPQQQLIARLATPC